MKKNQIKQESPAANALAVLQSLTRQLDVPVTRTTLKEQIAEHPHAPSLAALSDVLQSLQVDTFAAQLEAQDLREISYPAIAQLTQPQSEYVLLTGLQNESLSYINPRTGRVEESLTDFTQKWQGVTLLTEARPGAGERDYPQKRRKEQRAGLRVPVILASLALLLLVALPAGLLTYPQWVSWLPLLLLKLAGSAICVLLLLEENGSPSDLLKSVCNLNEKTSCQAVLASPAAKLWGWLGLSELGAFYFVGGLLSLSLALATPALPLVLGFLALVNLVALPYTFFSLYYQARVVKQWCPLCLGVVLLLWLEFGVFASLWLTSATAFNLSTLTYSLYNSGLWLTLPPLAFGFLLPLIAWLLLKPQLALAVQAPYWKKEALKLKRDPEYFAYLMDKQAPVQLTPFEGEFTVGHPEAPVAITMVTNPFCGPCTRAHGELEKLLEQYPDTLKLSFRFVGASRAEMANSDKPVPAINQVGEHVLALSLAEQELGVAGQAAYHALSAWFALSDKGEESLQSWKAAHPLPTAATLRYAEELLQAHIAWSNEANIQATPTVFVNNRPLPQTLALADLQYLLPHLAQAKVDYETVA